VGAARRLVTGFWRVDGQRRRTYNRGMIQLYHAPFTRADRPLWMLLEMGIPFELVKVDIGKEIAPDSPYLAIHPHAAVPVLVDRDVRIIESGAICAYLADKHLEKALAPQPNTPSRPQFYQWMFYCVATLEPPAYELVLQRKLLPEKLRSRSRLKDALERFHESAKFVDRSLDECSFILGETFTAADVMLGTTLLWNKSLLEGYRNLDNYVKRLSSRPALKRLRERYK
jgi:glutathione S-transferase